MFNKNFLLTIFAISGMTALIYEIAWIRPISLVFGNTIYAVSIIIATFILGLAIGSYIAGRFIDSKDKPLRYYAFIQLGIGAYGVIIISLLSILPYLFTDNFALQMITIFTIIAIPTILMGMTLPIIVKTFSSEIKKIGSDVGKLDASQNIGAVVGVLLAGFLMIPILGIQNTIITTAMINVLVGLTLIILLKESIRIKAITAVIVIIVGMAFFFPIYDEKAISYGIFANANAIEIFQDSETLFYKESAYSPVIIEQLKDSKVMKVGGRIQCSDSANAISGLERLATKPIELFYDKPKTSLVIGLGCGYTSQKLASFGYIDVTTIELDPEVARASKLFTDVPVIIDDGRKWLANSKKKFDIIITQPDHPYSGSWQLFTLEYFNLVNEHLTENGVSAQWIPATNMKLNDFYVTYNTFHEVFPYVYIYNLKEVGGHLIFIGSNVPLNASPERLYWGSYEKMVEHQTELSTDNKPLIEFATARNIYNPNPDEIFEELIKLRK